MSASFAKRVRGGLVLTTLVVLGAVSSDGSAAPGREPRIREPAHRLSQIRKISRLPAAHVLRAVEQFGEFVGLEIADRPPL